MHILAATDISSVPADYVKNFFIMLAFVIGSAGTGFFAYRKGKQATGTKDEPLNIAQPLDVRTVPEHAIKGDTQHELLRLNQKIEATTRENLRQHEATARRMDEVLKSGDERAVKILNALHEMETRMTTATLKEIKDVHERLNPMEAKVGGHHADLKHLNLRVAELWTWICKIFDQLPTLKKSK